MPYYRSADWFEDGQPATLPDDFYSSEFIVDRMIEYLDSDARKDAPFFAYLAYQAVHIPVQAPRELTEHYEGVYDDGWHALQERRARRLREQGLLNDAASLPPLHPSIRNWADVPEDERRLLVRSMAVHAGMLESMDHHIGRLIAHLRTRGLADDTLFVVTSDNGPEPSDPLAQPAFAEGGEHRQERFLDDLAGRLPVAQPASTWREGCQCPTLTDFDPMPVADGEFDLVLNRHSGLNAREVARILARDGIFLTQQIHGLWAEDLLAAFGAKPQWPDSTPEKYIPQLEAAGLAIVDTHEWSGSLEFTDVGAIVYYLKAVPWLVTGFSVESHLEYLLKLQEQKDAGKALVFTARKYLIEAQKRIPVD